MTILTTIDKKFILLHRVDMNSTKLDERDLQILSILSQEGRISKSELAKRVNLSATPCWERLKRLEEGGIIRGYKADVQLRKIVPHVIVFVVVELESHRAESFTLFEHAVSKREEIIACWALGGGFDYLMHIITSNIESYQRLIDDLLDQKVGLERYFTYVVTKSVKSGNPLPFESLLANPPGEGSTGIAL
ncbi:MAG: Lrp/AsnC family transcriptional regulator of ectoine degradation [Gammaproteobacteria bacterium]|jgi:Lrp/AsnC family transcriptional regulator of ectoine degradation